ncbi:MAG: glycosyltransferase family A protein, partial [Cyanobacteria bacterium P01_H01_bin.153]
MSDKESLFVSVIIPVYNQAESLQQCLAALAQQTYPRSQFEIIVIDNLSDDAEAITIAVAPYNNVKLVQESTPGSYAARNRGLTLASGEILAFTDADCIPATDWLAEGVHQLTQHPNCGQVVGAVEIFFIDPAQPTPIELFEQVTAFPQAQLLAQLHGGATANTFTWRIVMEAVGPFDAQLKSNGDLEWGQRVHAKGYLQIYADSVRVQHPARTSWSELATRTRRLVGGQYERQLKAA